MKDQHRCEYIVLVYAAAPGQKHPEPLAVVVREFVASDTRKLILHITPSLQVNTSKRHLTYFHELFESWREVSGDGVDRLFEQVRDLSSDLLRAQSTGFCSVDDLPAIVDHALRIVKDRNV